MSIKVMSKVWEESDASGADLLMLLALADSANDEGVTWPSIKTLAAKARVSVRAAQYTLLRLAAPEMDFDGNPLLPHIEIEPRTRGAKKGSTSNLYRLVRYIDPPVGAPGGAVGCTTPLQPTAPHRTVMEPSRVDTPSPSPSETTRGKAPSAALRTGLGSTPDMVPTEAPSGPGGKERRKTLYGDLFVAVRAAAGYGDQPIFGQDAKQVSAAAKTLEKMECSPQEIERALRWWMAEDWRGQRGDPPTPSQLLTTVVRRRAADPVAPPSQDDWGPGLPGVQATPWGSLETYDERVKRLESAGAWA